MSRQLTQKLMMANNELKAERDRAGVGALQTRPRARDAAKSKGKRRSRKPNGKR